MTWKNQKNLIIVTVFAVIAYAAIFSVMKGWDKQYDIDKETEMQYQHEVVK